MGSDDVPVRRGGDEEHEGVRRHRDALEAAVEAAGLAVWELDLVANTVRGSPALYRLLGYDSPPLAWTLKAFEHNIFPDDLPLVRAAIERARTDGQLRFEARVRRRDGRIAWIAALAKAPADTLTQPMRLAGVVQDITDRKMGHQVVRERDAQFSAMFDASSVGMAQADPVSGRLLRANDRLSTMLGYGKDELLGRRFLAFTHPDDRDASWNGFQRLVRGELSTFEIEKRLVRRRGGMLWVVMTVNLVRDALGVPQRAVAVVMDVTERKLAEQALLEREDELRQTRDKLEQRVHERTAELAEANTALVVEIAERRVAEQQVRELLGRLVQAVEDERSRISRELHDTLGQHLAALTFALQGIEAQGELPAQLHERLAKARQAAQLIDVELDHLSYELRPPALDDLGLEEALRSHASAWSAESGAAIEVHTHGLRMGRLPPLVETTVYRVVQEALTNVRKHAGASRVGLLAERRLDEVRVIIEDDGCGFDPAGVPRGGVRHFGLRSMAERASLVAGRLEVESLPGRGTTIYLAIPVGRESAGSPEAGA